MAARGDRRRLWTIIHVEGPSRISLRESDVGNVRAAIESWHDRDRSQFFTPILDQGNVPATDPRESQIPLPEFPEFVPSQKNASAVVHPPRFERTTLPEFVMGSSTEAPGWLTAFGRGTLAAVEGAVGGALAAGGGAVSHAASGATAAGGALAAAGGVVSEAAVATSLAVGGALAAGGGAVSHAIVKNIVPAKNPDDDGAAGGGDVGLVGLDDHYDDSEALFDDMNDVLLGTSRMSETAASLAGSGSAASSPSPSGRIRLLVDVLDNVPRSALMDAQGSRCVGCQHALASFDSSVKRSLGTAGGMLDAFASLLPSGTAPGTALRRQARLCEYTGSLYCEMCHENETAVLPRCVLWDWDFAPRKVCKLAHEFLTSIEMQPILCVDAVNPELYNRVHLLHECASKRRAIVQLCDRVPKHKLDSLLRSAGRLRYLCETPSFWAMRELCDLGKGAFSELPGYLDRLEGALHRIVVAHQQM